MVSSSRRGSIVLACSLLAAGCLSDAQRSNPLDPLADAYRDEGSLRGRVEDLAFRPVPGVLVHLREGSQESSITQSTDHLGAYQFSALPAKRYHLVVEKEGFVGASDSVEIAAGRTNEMPEIRLNALPVVTSAYAKTNHVSRWWPDHDLYLLEVGVSVQDPDDRPGVDAVWLLFSQPTGELPLPRGAVPGDFGAMIPSDSLPSASVHDMIGRPLSARIRDRDGHEVTRTLPSPARVIDYTPVAIAPQGQDLLNDPRPWLEWYPALLPFPHSYRIQVVRDEVNAAIVVQDYGDISSDSTTFKLQFPLGTGSYYWTISVVDTFGNASRSREAGFRIN